jgi:hypothetical protein
MVLLLISSIIKPSIRDSSSFARLASLVIKPSIRDSSSLARLDSPAIAVVNSVVLTPSPSIQAWISTKVSYASLSSVVLSPVKIALLAASVYALASPNTLTSAYSALAFSSFKFFSIFPKAEFNES